MKQYKIWENLPDALTALLFKQLDGDSLQICICSQVICWFNQVPAFWLQEENCDPVSSSLSSIVLLLISNKWLLAKILNFSLPEMLVLFISI